MADLFTLCVVLLVVAIVVIVLGKARRAWMSSESYKKMFAFGEAEFVEVVMKEVLAPLKEKIFADLKEHLKIVKGDVVEIGIGAGMNFDFYPDGTSLIAVDPNPYVEELLKKNLEKVGDKIHLKKFVVASAEDMSSTGKVGVEDNSAAAVVCTLVMCSIDDREAIKVLHEAKRVLKPGGRFFFIEHVAGKPWTTQYLIQQFLSKSLIAPTMANGCRSDRHTLSRIQETGFKTVQADKIWLEWPPAVKATIKSVYGKLFLRSIASVIFGFAEKGQGTEEKKRL